MLSIVMVGYFLLSECNFGNCLQLQFCVNDFESSVPDYLSKNTCKYADDCTKDEVVALESTSHMQDGLDASRNWVAENKMQVNPQKTKDMWICSSKSIPESAPLVLGNVIIERVSASLNYLVCGIRIS